MVKRGDGTSYQDITFARRWNGSQWVDTSLYRYDNGTAVKVFPTLVPIPDNLDRVYLYKSGDECTQYTGGWVSDFSYYDGMPADGWVDAQKRPDGLYTAKIQNPPLNEYFPLIYQAPGWRTKSKIAYDPAIYNYVYVKVKFFDYTHIIPDQYNSISIYFEPEPPFTTENSYQGRLHDYYIRDNEVPLNKSYYYDLYLVYKKQEGYFCISSYCEQYRNKLAFLIEEVFFSKKSVWD